MDVTIYSTKEQAEVVAKNDNLHVMKNGMLQEVNSNMLRAINYNYYATESKEISIDYYIDPEAQYIIHLTANWFKLPKIRKFDIMAVRWDNNVTIDWLYATQETDAGFTDYSLTGKNTKFTKKGLGTSMNLHNDAKEYIFLQIMVASDDFFGENIYGTYQHARHSDTNSLDISQSYTFASNGLGGVLYFSNATYRSYYDGMQDVKWRSQDY